MVNMLENHRLRSTFDFEKAVSREWDLFKHLSTGSGGEQLSWNFRLLDLAAGKGTAVDTIFMLKEAGIFIGAKRRLKFTGDEDTCGPDREATEGTRMKMKKKLRVEKSTPEKIVSRASVSLKMSKCSAGWHGNKRTPPKGQQTISRDMTGCTKTPKSLPRRRAKKKALNTTPIRGQSTILEYVSARKTVLSAGRAVSRNTEEVPEQTHRKPGV